MSSSANFTRGLEYAALTCTYPKVLEAALPLYPGTSYTLQKIWVVVGAILMFLTVINCLVQIGLHWLNYTRPNEQRQIVRLILFPLMFGVCNFLSLWQYPASPYLTQLAEFYEIIALVGMFLLLCYYVCPDPANFESYFAHLERLGWRRRVVHEDGSLRWFYWRWIALYQVVPIRASCTIAYWVTSATLCPTDASLRYARIALDTVESVSTTLATTSVIMFFIRLRYEVRPHGAVFQIFAFKTLVFLQLLQAPIFEGFATLKIIQPTKYVSYDDWTIGVPCFMTVCEAFIWSIIFIYPYRYTRYQLPRVDEVPKTRASPRQLPVPEAILHSLGVADIIMGFLFRNKMIAVWRKETTRKDRHSPPPAHQLPPVNFDVAGTGVPGVPVDRDLAKELQLPPPQSFKDARNGSSSAADNSL